MSKNYQIYAKAGKGGKIEKARFNIYGYRTEDIGRTGKRKTQDINTKSLTEINKLLTAKGITNPQGYTSPLTQSDRLRYMNMKIMAEVILFVQSYGGTDSDPSTALRWMTKNKKKVGETILNQYFAKIKVRKEDEDATREDETVQPRYIGEFLAYLRYYESLYKKKDERSLESEEEVE